jgi:hypothetical protein
MIHGEGDTYIKPLTARALFDRAGDPKELWLVKGAKHNQGLTVAGEEYRRRVLSFFEAHLASQQSAVSEQGPVRAEAPRLELDQPPRGFLAEC